MTTEKFHAFLGENGYFEIRELPDGTTAALYRLMFTTAICTGLDDLGWAYRWCFADAALASSELAKLEAMDDKPTGYVAHRGGA
jgi:hypothetical protein